MEDKKETKDIFEAVSQFEKAQYHPQKEEQAQDDKELQKLFQKCMQFHKELDQSLEKLFVKHRIRPSKYQAYITRPQNFSQKQWELLETQKKENETLLKKLSKKIAEQKPPESTPQHLEKKPKKKKKLKALPKRRWLEMR